MTDTVTAAKGGGSMNAGEDVWLWPEQVSVLAGVGGGDPRKGAQTIRQYETNTRNRQRRGKQLDAGDMPLRGRTRRRYVGEGSGRRLVSSPQWRESAITIWLANRKGPGGRPLAQ